MWEEDYEEELDEEDKRKAIDKHLSTERAIGNKIDKGVQSGTITKEEGDKLFTAFNKKAKKIKPWKWFAYRQVKSSYDVLCDIFEEDTEMLEILKRLA